MSAFDRWTARREPLVARNARRVTDLGGFALAQYGFASIEEGRGLDMCSTCVHHNHMGTMIQIRNVPDAIHRELKSRAALAGMSLSDYLLHEIRQVAERPTLDQMRARLNRHPAITLSLAPAEAVRAERDNH